MKLNKISSFIVLLLLISIRITAQNQNIDFEDSKFPDKINDLRKAQKNIQRADHIIANTAGNFKSNVGHYEEALKYYMQAYDFNPYNALLNYKIGVGYMSTLEKYKAALYLEKAYILDKKVKNDCSYILAQAYQFNYEFDNAIQKYTEYQKSLNSFDKDAVGTEVAKKITECINAKEFIKNPVDVTITNLGPTVNSKYPEYSPIVNADRTMMFFTARKSNTTDIYVTYFKNGAWCEPKNMGKSLNTKTNDAIVGISQDGKILLIYRATPDDNGDIYISNLKKGDKYTTPKRLNKNINTPFHETSATLSPDGNTLYFISDREGGYGGKDIWMSQKDSKGEWGEAVNLGPAVNSSYDEESVFMQADGKTLYFSSKGHNSMGGYDIFKTTLVNDKWTVPVNLGYPINTPDDDVSFSITQDGQHGYYASGEKGGFGDLDIYEIEFTNVKIKTIVVKGYVLDGETKKPLAGTVKIKNKITNMNVSTINTPAESGEFFATLPKNKAYVINAASPGYTPYFENIPAGKKYDKTISLYSSNKKIMKSNTGNILDYQTKKTETVNSEKANNAGENVNEKSETLKADSVKVEVKNEQVPDNKKSTGVVFKVQFASSPEKKDINSSEFKDLGNVDFYFDKGLYKYTSGNEKDLTEAKKILKTLNEKGFKDAFIIAFSDGKKISIPEALKLQKTSF